MKFVHPMVLWALGILLIPIIVHLFNFRRYKTLYFSSLQFIKKIEKETNSTRKLRHYLILFSRLLAFIALVLAFAQPYIPLEDGETEQYENITAIYLDNSYSMSAKGTNGDLLNQSKETIRNIVDQSEEGQKFMLVTNNLSGIEHRIITKNELLDRLESLSLSPIHRRFSNPMNSIKNHLDQKSFLGTRHYIAISDFQSNNFDEVPLKNDTLGVYLPLKISPQTKKNLFIDSVWFDNPFQRINQNNTLNVRVNNSSTKEITNAELNLEIGKLKRQTLVDISANTSEIVKLNYTDKEKGEKYGTVEIKDDQLYFDDVFFFSYEVKNNLQVKIVAGEQATIFPNMVFKTDDFYEVENINLEQLQISALKQADLLVLNGLQTFSSGLSSSLLQFINSGGSVCVVPGDNIDLNAYNQFLKNVNLPLINSMLDQDLRIGKIYSDQLFFSGMFDKNVDRITMPPLKRVYSTSRYTSSNYLSLVDLENNSPFFVHHGGNLSIFCFYTALNESFNNFSKSALFSSLLLRTGEVSQSQNQLQLTIGGDRSYKLRSSKNQDSPVELRSESISFIPELSSNGVYDEISVRLAKNNEGIKAGNYEIIRDNKKMGVLSLNFDRKESLLEYYSTSEINNYFEINGIQNVNSKEIIDFQDIEKLSVEKPNEYWRILLILALGFFLVEMIIVLFWKV